MIIETVWYCAASAVTPFSLYIAYQYRNKIKNLFKSTILDDPKLTDALDENNPVEKSDLPTLGLTYEEYELQHPETEEEYLKRLRTIHPDAYKEFKNTMNDRIQLDECDMIVYKALLDYKSGKLKIDERHNSSYTLRFKNGLEIWIENKYFGFGHIHFYEVNGKSYKFRWDEGRLSEYTFMWLVDIVYEHESYVVWKQRHDNYTRDIIEKQSKK